MTAPYAVGWDVGGANLKVAIAEGGKVQHAAVMPCPLWQGLEHLHDALRAAPLPPREQISAHAVTMTGELCDLFPDRRAGVRAIVETMVARLPGGPIGFYSLDDRLLDGSRAMEQWADVASANWMATASHAAARVAAGVLIDIGSTTTDLVPLLAGRCAAQATTDAGRLQQGELLYAGVLRTPVMALADRLPWDGAWSDMAAEHFATTADVYRLTGELGQDDDDSTTADGAGKSAADSARRLLRHVGVDFEAALLPGARLLARHLADRQSDALAAALDRISSRRPETLPGTLVGAGVGRFLVRRLAGRLAVPYQDFGELPGMNGSAAAVAAPACVMALRAGGAGTETPRC